ncbi:hypothetical protein E4U32_007825 [Claviceps aff. humidiphila group G2b]|nr:hypothetical protein E4U32_007825 [Claviceps aff. humidiphila group G2b]
MGDSGVRTEESAHVVACHSLQAHGPLLSADRLAMVGYNKLIPISSTDSSDGKSCDNCVMRRQGHTMACFMDRLLPSLASYTSCSQAPASSNGDTITFSLAMDCIENKFVIGYSVVIVRTNSMLQA